MARCGSRRASAGTLFGFRSQPAKREFGQLLLDRREARRHLAHAKPQSQWSRAAPPFMTDRFFAPIALLHFLLADTSFL
jgi:hypothetical protein